MYVRNPCHLLIENTAGRRWLRLSYHPVARCRRSGEQSAHSQPRVSMPHLPLRCDRGRPQHHRIPGSDQIGSGFRHLLSAPLLELPTKPALGPRRSCLAHLAPWHPHLHSWVPKENQLAEDQGKEVRSLAIRRQHNHRQNKAVADNRDGFGKAAEVVAHRIEADWRYAVALYERKTGPAIVDSRKE